jgi:predicted porin
MARNTPKVVALASLALAAAAATPAFAQSSVTLYGIADTGISYQNSQTSLGSTTNGHSNTKLVSGVWGGSRFGFKGVEDLGGGTKALFQLESGYNIDTGGQQYTNALFGRQAWVGLSNQTYGMLQAGRQYTAYYTLLSPYSPTTWLTGFAGAHPGDLDSLDTVYRADNSLVYTSPKIYGLTFSGSYSFGGVAGSVNQGSTWSGGLLYQNGPIGLAAGFMRVNNSTPGGGVWGANSTLESAGQSGVSAVTNGYQTAKAQQRFAVTGGYTFSSAFDITFSYSNVEYIPGINSKFTDTAVFNTAGIVFHWKALPALDLAAGYSYTRATKANGISSVAQYNQFNLSQYYSLSKRTGLYLLEAYQRTNGQTLGTNGAGNIIDATAVIGDGFQSAPSSSRNMINVTAGIIHRF